MNKQVTPPVSLVEFQEKFGQSIRTPIGFETGTFEFLKNHYHNDIVDLMIPREDLAGIDRLMVYNQQYWYRLLTIMQDDFPLLRHFLTVWDFNQLACAYLTAYPSENPSLSQLADRFPKFMTEEHHWNNKLNKQTAELEFIYLKAFDALEKESYVNQNSTVEELFSNLETPFNFQPSLYLFEENWNLVKLRYQAAIDDDDKETIKPQLENNYWIIFRQDNIIEEKVLTKTQYTLLRELQDKPLTEALDACSKNLKKPEQKELEENIQSWFHDWASWNIFVEA